MSSALRLSVVILSVVLAGCSTIVHPEGAADQAAWQARRQRLAGVDNWHLQGRIGVATPHKGGSASLDWREQGDIMTLLLSGPFGLGAVRLRGTAQAMQVRDSKGHSWTTYDPERALESSLGWPLPIASLRYWVLGLPAPGVDFKVDVGSRGLPSRLAQQGWSVRYNAFKRSAGLFLPQNLSVTRGSTRIKVIVSDWSLGGAKP